MERLLERLLGVVEFYGDYSRRTGKKDWNDYEVVPLRKGQWAISNKRTKMPYAVFDTEEKANQALLYYKQE